MTQALVVAIGQCSDRGRKPANQDFHGAIIPQGAELALKGVALAIADGISTSPVSHIAAETAVKTFLADYYCTPAAWSARTAGTSVITAANAWLYSETRRGQAAIDPNRGYVCTFSAVAFKGRQAYVFHVGDSRVSRVAGDGLEPLTNDHRTSQCGTTGYLTRALGAGATVEVECAQHLLATGDLFVLSTDGVHDFLPAGVLVTLIREHATDLDRAARAIVDAAIAAGSDDNLTIQIARIEALPDIDAADLLVLAEDLPAASIGELPATIDGYRLIRQIHINERSHIYLAIDEVGGARVALKFPARSLREHPWLARRFLMEDWIARRVSSPHLLRAHGADHAPGFLYTATEYIEGQSLRQWMHEHPRPSVDVVRGLIGQLVAGVRAMHRREMIHCDLRPENVMVDRQGTVRIIDFGSVRVTGLIEAGVTDPDEPVLGTVQYTAPEWLAGEAPSWRSDLYSVAVIAYEMLTGRLPYGAAAARVRSPAQQHALRYAPARRADLGVPWWVDGALRKALHPDPARRYGAMSEFMQDLQVPNQRFASRHGTPLLERDPERFWKGLALVLAILLVIVLASHR